MYMYSFIIVIKNHLFNVREQKQLQSFCIENFPVAFKWPQKNSIDANYYSTIDFFKASAIDNE